MKNQNLPLLIMMILVLDSFIHSAAAEDFILQSPDGNLRATISVQNQITYSLFWKQKQFLAPSSLSLSLNDERTLGHQPQVHESSYRLINEMIAPPIREKQAIIHHIGNELTLTFTSQYKLLFRAYDNGFAYRWITDFEKPMVVKSELVEFRIADDDALLYLPLLPDRPDVDKFHCSYEENYSVLSMRELKPEYIAYLPLMVKLSQGLSLVITEADLQDYPGLYLSGHTQTAGFSGVFPGYPLEEKMNGSEFKQKVVTRRADYLAETNGCRTFPWRVLLLAEDDAKLIENSMVYCLGTPCVLTDTDWIRPGKCTDDWTIDTNLYNVPFRAGLNTETYKFFIDFAANFKIPYVMLDAGWSNNDNLAEINPQVNFEEVRAYAGKKGVGLFLWTLAMTLDSQLEDACRRFQEWGIKGIMVDFMDRDDQKMVQFYQRVAKVTAEHHLMVLFHGAFKPTGLRRTYPNIVTREAVLGHEYNKWSDKVTPDHIAMLPFIRMTAGPLDYEGGPMLNAQQGDFRAIFNKPMSQGTRIHELALYVIFESPQQYLAGNPSDYMREPEFTQFLVDIPTTWDEIVALEGRVGDYLLLARRHDRDWYLAAITDWTARQMKVSLNFLTQGQWQAEIYCDGINADRYASDYAVHRRMVQREDTLMLELAPAGGWVARLSPQP